MKLDRVEDSRFEEKKPKPGGLCGHCGNHNLAPSFEVERYRDTVISREGVYVIFCQKCGGKNKIDERVYENFIDIYTQAKHMDTTKVEIINTLRDNFNKDFINKKITLLESDLEFTVAEVSLSGGLRDKLERINIETSALVWLLGLVSDIEEGKYRNIQEKRVSSKIKKYTFFG